MFTAERLETLDKETLIDIIMLSQEELKTEQKLSCKRYFRIKRLQEERDELKQKLAEIQAFLRDNTERSDEIYQNAIKDNASKEVKLEWLNVSTEDHFITDSVQDIIDK